MPIYDRENDHQTEAERQHFARLAAARNGRPVVIEEPEHVEVVEHGVEHGIWRSLQDEWDFYFPKGPPQTYTNGDLMDPKDASSFGSLTALAWVFGLVVLASFVVLVILTINGT